LVPAILLAAALQTAAGAAEASRFQIDTPRVGLNGTLWLWVDGDATIDPAKVTLRLDHRPLSVQPEIEPLGAPRGGHQLSFLLVRNDDNRLLWSHLLGRPFSHKPAPEVPVSLDLGDKPLAFSAAEGRPDKAVIVLIRYDPGKMAFGLVFAVLVVAVTILLGWRTSMLRDDLLDPQVHWAQRPYSLGRTQMALWFCLIIASFVFILVVTGDFSSITAESFTLLGISGATALGAVAVDRTRDPTNLGTNPALAGATATLAGLGLSSLSEVNALHTTVVRQKQGVNAAPQAVTAALTAVVTQQQRWDAYLVAIAPFKTRGFFRDILNDVNGPTIHRWQIVIWTVLLGGIYVWRTYANLETPAFGANLLALMGIGGGVYLGFKIPEKQS
jgi:hypothetical protein